MAPAGKSMLIRKLPGNTGFTAVNFAAIGSIAFLTVAAAVTTTLTKHGHMTAPDEGTVLDLLRLIPYALAGLLVVRNRGGLRHVFGLTAFLVIVARLAVSLTSAGPLGSLVENLSSFFLGSALIGVACWPLFSAIAGASYTASNIVVQQEDVPRGRSKVQLALFCSSIALMAPVVYALSSYILLGAHSMPLFVLSFSIRVVPILQYVFGVLATGAVILAVVDRHARQARNWPAVFLAVAMLGAAIALMLAMPSV